MRRATPLTAVLAVAAALVAAGPRVIPIEIAPPRVVDLGRSRGKGHGLPAGDGEHAPSKYPPHQGAAERQRRMAK